MHDLFRVRFTLVAFIALTLPLSAGTVPYNPPAETAAFKAGPGADVVDANCRTCHSADYIGTQPKGAAFGTAFWQAEVTKMISVYGAPIAPQDAKIIVDYLSAVYR